MTKHAKLSPSASERWINCPISVHLSEGFEDTPSVYAAEGSLAHRLAELKIIQELTDDPADQKDFKKVRSDKLYNPEMEEHTDTYLEQVRAVYKSLETPFITPETKVDLTDIIGAESFGTADCIICAPEIIHIFDFKYGKNVEVSAIENPQMRLYALGAAEMFDPIYGIEKVNAHIVQPRMNNFSSEEISLKELRKWAEEIVRPAAHKAVTVSGDACKGSWCMFCQAKPLCREYGREFQDLPAREDPYKLSPEEIAYTLAKLEGVDTYLKTLKEYALSETLKGNKIPGYKAVEGRSNRSWSNEDEAFRAAEEAGVKHSDLYEEKRKTLAKLEKLIGKKKFNEILGSFVVKPQGKPTLVKDSDSRKPFKRRPAKESFQNIDVSQIQFS